MCLLVKPWGSGFDIKATGSVIWLPNFSLEQLILTSAQLQSTDLIFFFDGPVKRLNRRTYYSSPTYKQIE